MYNRLKKLRENYSFTLNEISKELNISVELYTKYENGKTTIPINILSKIARIYNTSIDFIVEDTDEQKPHKKLFKT